MAPAVSIFINDVTPIFSGALFGTFIIFSSPALFLRKPGGRIYLLPEPKGFIDSSVSLKMVGPSIVEGTVNFPSSAIFRIIPREILSGQVLSGRFTVNVYAAPLPPSRIKKALEFRSFGIHGR